MLSRALFAGSIWFTQATNRIAAEHNARYFSMFRLDFTGKSPCRQQQSYATPCRERIARRRRITEWGRSATAPWALRRHLAFVSWRDISGNVGRWNPRDNDGGLSWHYSLAIVLGRGDDEQDSRGRRGRGARVQFARVLDARSQRSV